MRKNGYSLGGEQSGHLIFLDHTTTGDGTLAALQLLAVMCRSGKPLSELASIFEPVPQTLVNVVVKQKKELGELKASGVLTDAEFEAQKAKILAAP